MWKLTLGDGTRDGFHFVSPLVFGVGPRSLVTQTTHPPKNNETLITTFVLFYAVFVVQRFRVSLFSLALVSGLFTYVFILVFPKLF
jgi:hypothetical protein